MTGFRHRISHAPRITSFSNLHTIGLAIGSYAENHRMLPLRLSNLVPDCIPTNEIAIFYVLNQDARQDILPSDLKENPTYIDLYSSYVYLGTNGVRGIIAYEKTNLWKSTATYPDKVAVLFFDFHVQYVSIVELQKMLFRL